ncbi:Ubiquinone biosynthesis monooxygenase UbiB [Raoultella ornithinolytica]|nr:Ubiquinone biosynthesis monooxygenase UbiB [Raoultella ornithinolytica]
MLFAPSAEPIFEKPLAEISFGHVLLNLFNTARRFNMEVQPQLVLLQKTLLYVEGVGRQLYPQLDLWKTAKPFLESWIKDQVGIPALVRAFKEKAPFWIERMPEIPELVYQTLQQSKQLQTSVDTIVRDFPGATCSSGAVPLSVWYRRGSVTEWYAVIYPPPGMGHDARLADGRWRGVLADWLAENALMGSAFITGIRCCAKSYERPDKEAACGMTCIMRPNNSSSVIEERVWVVSVFGSY